MFHLAYPLAKLTPAPENPRRISDSAFQQLVQSLGRYGVLKPLIAHTSGKLIAGHQRMRALQELGWQRAPVVLVERLNDGDILRFNQLHNGTDLDTGDEAVMLPPAPAQPFVDVPAEAITGNLRASGAVVRNEICGLLERYGPWGGVVAAEDGTCLSGAQYALACYLLGLPCRTVYVPQEDAETVHALFQARYGTFSYAHLPKLTYAQTYVQLARETSRESPTYEELVIPELRKDEHLLDFGCGHGDYVKRLRDQGYAVWGLEFFRRTAHAIDTRAVNRMIDELFAHLREHGRFDVVVCDYVMNSTDSIQAEADVLALVNAFARPGARVYISGRCRSSVDTQLSYTQSTISAWRGLEFLDDDGYSAIYRNGHWIYQRFHTREEVARLMELYFGDVGQYQAGTNTWQVRLTKRHELYDDVIRAALAREFDLPWPEGRRIGRSADALAAWSALNLAAEQRAVQPLPEARPTVDVATLADLYEQAAQLLRQADAVSEGIIRATSMPERTRKLVTKLRLQPKRTTSIEDLEWRVRTLREGSSD